MIIYCATNRRNGKRYVGISRGSLEERRARHLSDARRGRHGVFLAALRKHGAEAFRWETLGTFETVSDALVAEVALIAESKPEYNVAPGGQYGANTRSAEWRAAIAASVRKSWSNENRRILQSLATRGKARWNSADRERLRQLAMRTKDAWLTGPARLGPKAISRSVECLDDGLIYDSATAAARAYAVAKSALIELCLGQRGRKTVGGKRFRYVVEDNGLR
jgi:group I intron endonuclease